MQELTDEWFKRNGFDTSKEPFVNLSGSKTVYKNYIRDGSGRYDGYIIQHVCTTITKTEDDFLKLRSPELNKYEKACKVFLKGCTGVDPDRQEDCPECLSGFITHIRNLGKIEDFAEMNCNCLGIR